MKSYKITYRETRDSETQTCIYRGHDAEHAMERFIDSMVEDGGYFGPENVESATLVKSKNTQPKTSAWLNSRSRQTA